MIRALLLYWCSLGVICFCFFFCLFVCLVFKLTGTTTPSVEVKPDLTKMKIVTEFIAIVGLLG